MFKIFIYDLNGGLFADMNAPISPMKGDFIELVGFEYEVLAKCFNYGNNPYHIKLTIKR